MNVGFTGAPLENNIKCTDTKQETFFLLQICYVSVNLFFYNDFQICRIIIRNLLLYIAEFKQLPPKT